MSNIKPLISIVTPCFNEEGNIEKHFELVRESLKEFEKDYYFEHIYTDNYSTDSTFEKLTNLAAKFKNVKVLRFSRNIGANRSIYQGLIRTKGQAVILIQADLQDPPSLLPIFIREWEKGYDVVYGQIINREESYILKKLRIFYYKLIRNLSDFPIPLNAGEFRLTSQRVVKAIGQYSEDDTYLRGIVAHIGFKQKAIPYNREARDSGKSSNNIISLLNYALNGIVSTSAKPLRAASILGLIISAATFSFGTYSIIYKLIFPEYVPHGITIILAMNCFLTGIQLIFLGIVGEYIRKIHNQSLNRPMAHIQDAINFDHGICSQ